MANRDTTWATAGFGKEEDATRSGKSWENDPRNSSPGEAENSDAKRENAERMLLEQGAPEDVPLIALSGVVV